MRPTPRVDAAAERGSDLGMANMTWSGIWPLARTLERELAEAVELLKQFTKPTVSEFADYEPIGESPIITVGKLFDEARAFLQRIKSI